MRTYFFKSTDTLDAPLETTDANIQHNGYIQWVNINLDWLQPILCPNVPDLV